MRVENQTIMYLSSWGIEVFQRWREWPPQKAAWLYFLLQVPCSKPDPVSNKANKNKQQKTRHDLRALDRTLGLERWLSG